LAQATGATQAQLELELQRLQEQLAARTRALFGASSERRGGGARDDAASAPAPRRGHGPREQATLPVVEVVHTRPADAAPCPPWTSRSAWQWRSTSTTSRWRARCARWPGWASRSTPRRSGTSSSR